MEKNSPGVALLLRSVLPVSLHPAVQRAIGRGRRTEGRGQCAEAEAEGEGEGEAIIGQWVVIVRL